MAFMLAGRARTSTPVKCGPPLLIPFTVALIYPMPSATGVPAGSLSIVIASRTQQLSVPVSISATQSAQGSPLTLWQPAPSPLPSPAAASPPGSYVFAAPAPALQANTTYYVMYQFGTFGPCNAPMLMGQFTTQ